MGFFWTVAGAIDSYTGLSPAAFFTILSLMVGVYFLVSSFFVSPDEAKNSSIPSASDPPAVPAQPVQLGDATLEELKAFDGSDPKKPLLMAIKGNIYDVSRSRMFYGPGGPYALFAGRDASRALALMSFDPDDLTGSLEGLSSAELEVLQDWEHKFMEKYAQVGQLVSEKTARKVGDQNNEKTAQIQDSLKANEDDKRDAEAKEIESDGRGS